MLSPILMCVSLLLAPADAKLPAKERKQLRETLTTMLAEPDLEKQADIAALVLPLEKKYAFADLVAAVRQGPILKDKKPGAREGETHTVVGNTIVGYAFESAAGHTYRYAVSIPKSYDPKKAHGLLIDPGHGTGAKQDDKGKAGFIDFYRGQADRAGCVDWLVARTEIIEQAGGGGISRDLPEEELVGVFDRFYRDLCSRFHVDPDRVYMAGLSQTGFWSWYLGKARADRLAGIVPMGSRSWHVDHYASNLLNLPMYVLHGAQDETCIVSDPRRTTAQLGRLGCPVTYVEFAEAGHTGAVWSHLHEGLTWATAQPRRKYPKRVSKNLQTTADGWCHWLRIDAIEKEDNGKAFRRPTAGMDGRIDGQVIHLYSEGVDEVTVFLSSDMLDLAQPIQIIWNGKKAHDGIVPRSLATLLGSAAEKIDWKGTFEAGVSLRR